MIRHLCTIGMVLVLTTTARANDPTVRYVMSGTLMEFNAGTSAANLSGTIWDGVDVGTSYRSEIVFRSTNPTLSADGSAEYEVVSSSVTVGSVTVELPPANARIVVRNDLCSIVNGNPNFTDCRDAFGIDPGSLISTYAGGEFFGSDEVSCSFGNPNTMTCVSGCLSTALTSDAPPLEISPCFDSANQEQSLGLREGGVTLASIRWQLTSFSATIPYRYISSCNGDGGDQMGCTDCPCSNNALPGTVGGCLNSAGASAQLEPSGFPSVASDTMRFEMSGGVSSSFGVLTSGNAIAPTNAQNPCFGLDSGSAAFSLDGLRCAVQGVQRHGARSIDASGNIGDTTNGWGLPDGPPNGLIAQGGFVAGQTRHYQVIYREEETLSCMTGQNTSQAVTVTFEP